MANWTEDLIAEACRLWDLGWSALEIGNALAVSRNAVIGKIHRQRLAGHKFTRVSLTKEQIAQNAATLHAAKEIARQKREAAALERRAVRGGNIARAVAQPQAFAPAVVIDATHAKPWTERAFGECAFPIAGEGADTVSCCGRTGGQTYCQAHHQVMFQPRPMYQQKADKRMLAHLSRRFAA